MKNKDIIEIKIEDLSDNGKGIGFINDNGKKYSIFVPLTVKGDLVKCKINNIKKLYIEADLIEIIEKSKYRIKAICKHFNECGACDLLHINYNEQINAKKRILERYLKRNNLKYNDLIVIKSEKEHFYRDRSKFFKINNYFGFKKRRTNEIVKIDKCYIINNELNKIFSKKTLKKIDDEIIYGYCYKRKQISKAKCVYYTKNHTMVYRPDLFVQSNLTMNNKLIEIVYNESEGKTLLDLYSGNGNFSIALSDKFNKIISVEGCDKSFKLLQENIKLNNINNIEPLNEDVNNFFIKTFDTIILDPPRTGTENLINSIKFKTNKIIYISCNAKQTIKEIKQLDNFYIDKVYLIDMFPQTIHFESVFVLERINN
ncbi:MAG: class I SAM-dependent RNA methyltransferase [Candidatus Woesearchaeota archaeon]